MAIAKLYIYHNFLMSDIETIEFHHQILTVYYVLTFSFNIQIINMAIYEELLVF